MPDYGLAAQTERELNYYRRECNLLGARLVRIQEEQGQAYREARRSRTVVKLVREAYRLGDLKTIGADIGGPMLEILVDNTLCDRAALLREEPLGSGRFVVSHAIGLTLNVMEAIFHIPSPPPFCFSSVQEPLSATTQWIAAVLQLPYILWSHDPNSGQALLIGNRSESNVSRPFEAGDQELIESALSVYLDVIYRKQVEAELRRAKQAAESASQTRSELLDMLAQDLRPALQALGCIAARIRPPGGSTPCPDAARDAEEIARTTAYMLSLLDDAVRSGERREADAELDIEWVPVEDLVRAVLRMVYVPSVRRSIDLDATLPRRRTAICVDRARMIQVLRFLISGAMRRTLEGGIVRVTTARRSDGALEILVRGGVGLALAQPADTSAGDERTTDPLRMFGSGLGFTRQLIEAQGATLLVEAGLDGVAQTRILVPAHMTRDDDVAAETVP